MDSLKVFSLDALQEALISKRCSARELTQSALAVAEKNEYNSFITVCRERALKQADICDNNIKNNQVRPLEGIPYAAKDLFCTKDVLTTCASKMLSNFIPPYESAITQVLNDAGAIMIGKLNMDEFAMGSANITSYYGPCINPLADKRDTAKKLVPGGSSGGSAVSIVEGSAIFSLGTDTGGSVRQPAAFCGIVGVKPSYGLASRYGLIAYASSLDQAGVMAKSVADAAKILNIMCYHDPREATSIPTELRKFQDFGHKIGQSLKGLKIGVPREYIVDDMGPNILGVWQQSVRKLADLGAEIVAISLPNIKHAIEVYYIISTAEASSNLARFDGIRYGYCSQDKGLNLQEMYVKNRGEGFGAEVKRRILLGTFVLDKDNYQDYYVRASCVRRVIKSDFDKAWQLADVMICPTTPSVAFGIKDDKVVDPVMMYLNDIFTVPVNLIGLPGGSVPAGTDEDSGLPIGMQIIAAHMKDDLMLQVMSALQT